MNILHIFFASCPFFFRKRERLVLSSELMQNNYGGNNKYRGTYWKYRNFSNKKNRITYKISIHENQDDYISVFLVL